MSTKKIAKIVETDAGAFYRVTVMLEMPLAGMTGDTLIKLVAARRGKSNKMWSASKAQLTRDLSSIIGERHTIIVMEKLEAGAANLPGMYTPHHLVQLGFRIEPQRKHS